MLRARSNISSCMLQKQTIQLLLLRTAFIASHTHVDTKMSFCYWCVCVHFALLKAALLSQQTSCEIGLWVFFRSYPADGYWKSAAMRWWACFLCVMCRSMRKRFWRRLGARFATFRWFIRDCACRAEICSAIVADKIENYAKRLDTLL